MKIISLIAASVLTTGVIGQATPTSDVINLKGYFHLNSVSGLTVNSTASYEITELEKGKWPSFFD